MGKICNKCNIEKELDEFYFSKVRNSYENSCKKCRCELSKISWEERKKNNPEYDKNRGEKQRKQKPELVKKYNKNRYSKNKEYWKEYKEKNIDKIKKYSISYRKDNKDKLNDYTKNRNKQRRKKEPIFRLINSARSAVNRYLNKNNLRTFDIVGCSPQELKEHIEKQFKIGMDWENHGKYGWHIDHIIPLSSAKNEYELKRLCHYKNLQPLWFKDNLSKGAKILT
jgi:hypothetical protein